LGKTELEKPNLGLAKQKSEIRAVEAEMNDGEMRGVWLRRD
jgi:hypothetical protein